MAFQIFAHECVIVKVRIGGVDTVDFLGLTGRERLLGIQTADGLDQALSAQYLMHTCDASAEMMGGIKEGAVAIGHLCRQRQQLGRRLGIAKHPEHFYDLGRPDRPMAQKAATEAVLHRLSVFFKAISGQQIDDDVIIVAKTDPEDYELGQVVVYQEGRMLVVHEIIDISENGQTITTQGTANSGADDPINVKYVKGRVVKVLPGLGKAVNFIKTPTVTVIIVAVAALLLVLSYRKEKPEDENGGEDDLERIRAEIERLKAEQEKKTK